MKPNKMHLRSQGQSVEIEYAPLCVAYVTVVKVIRMNERISE